MKKYLLPLVLAFCSLGAGCSSFEETAEPSGDGPVMREASVRNEEPAEVNPYSLEVMRRAVAEVAGETSVWRARGQVTEPGAADAPPEATHRYVHFKPANRWQLDALLDRRDFQCFNFRLDQPGELPEGETFVSSTRSGSPDELYAVLSTEIALPDTIVWEVLEEYYDPRATAEGTADEEWAEAVESRARTLSNNSLIDPGDWGAGLPWTPSGTIFARDNVSGYFLPIEGAKVTIIPPLSAGGNLRMWTVYTNRNGEFRAPQQVEYGGRVTYSLSWDSDDWTMKNDAESYVTLRSGAMNGAWDVKIDYGDVSLYNATVFRAAYFYWYESKYHKLTPPNFGRPARLVCHDARTSPDGKAGGYFHSSPGNGPDIDVWCGGGLLPSQYFSTAAHEIGHAAHYTHNRSWFNTHCDDEIIESWAKFTGYYIPLAYYKLKGVYGFDKTVVFENVEQKFIGGLVVVHDKVTCNIPSWNNWQHWQWDPMNIEDGNPLPSPKMKYYTPFFIDMYDDSNQYFYYQEMNKRGESDVNLRLIPKDNICINDPAKIEEMAFASRIFQDATALLKNCYETYGNDKWSYNDFVEFYNMVGRGEYMYNKPLPL